WCPRTARSWCASGPTPPPPRWSRSTPGPPRTRRSTRPATSSPTAAPAAMAAAKKAATGAGKPVRDSLSEVADLMFPPDANMHGTVFGGKVLQMVDKAASVCAMRHAGKPVVTVAMERVEFLVPIKVGTLLIASARVNHVGRTSMEIGVEVYSEDM